MNELLNQLTEIIARLQEIAPSIWATMQRQVAINIRMDVVWIVLCLLAVVSCALVIKWAARRTNDDKNSNDDGFISFMVIIAASIVGIIALIATIVYADEVIRMALNPDYYAIQMLLGR